MNRPKRPFDPTDEIAAALRYKMLAQVFDADDTRAVHECFMILVSLCQQKAKVFADLDDSGVFTTELVNDEPAGKFLSWPGTTKVSIQ